MNAENQLTQKEKGSWLEDVYPGNLPEVRRAYQQGLLANGVKHLNPFNYGTDNHHAWDLGMRRLPITSKLEN